MNTMTQAFRTTCIPTESKVEAFIPPEYVGQEVEIVIIPICKEPEYNADECPLCAKHNHEYNAETLAAIQEAEDIALGKIQAKRYKTVAEMNADIDAEEDD